MSRPSGPFCRSVEASGVVLCLLRHYRLRLTAGLEEDDLVLVLDGVNDLDVRL